MVIDRKPDGSTPAPNFAVPTLNPDVMLSTNSTRSNPNRAAPGNEAGYSIVNEGLTMKGDLESDGGIVVKGRINGNIRCKMLIVDPSAVVEGGITADEVVIGGTACGIIKAKRVRLEKTANVDSEIFYDTFSAEEGAKIKGALRSNEELNARAAQLQAVQNARESPEQKVSSALFQMLDGARSAGQPRLAAAQ